MDTRWRITFQDGSPQQAERLNPEGQTLATITDLLTLTELCRRLGKSRRQIYRDLREGKLQALGKFGSLWLFSSSGLPLPPSRRVPESLSPLFPERDIRSIDPDRESSLVLSRLLENGSREEVLWGLRHYGTGAVTRFLRSAGRHHLSPKSLAFWSWIFGEKMAATAPAWRQKGTKLWGIGFAGTGRRLLPRRKRS